MQLRRERIALIATSSIALFFAILWGVQYQDLKISESAANALYLQIDKAKAEAEFCATNYRAYTRTPAQEEFSKLVDRALNCEQARSQEAQQGPTTTTLLHVLEKGNVLVEEWDRGRASIDHFFWLLPNGAVLDAGPEPEMVIGSFPAISDREPPVNVDRLANGLYRLNVTADYTEAGETHTVWIDPTSLRFLALGQFSPSDGISVKTQDIDGSLTPHYQRKDCATSSSAIVDGLTWNGELIYRFTKPLRVECWFSDLHGADVVEFFGGGSPEVSRDLKIAKLPLVIGKKLRLHFQGSAKPTVTIE